MSLGSASTVFTPISTASSDDLPESIAFQASRLALALFQVEITAGPFTPGLDRVFAKEGRTVNPIAPPRALSINFLLEDIHLVIYLVSEKYLARERYKFLPEPVYLILSWRQLEYAG
jgi:hypothetical protein